MDLGLSEDPVESFRLYQGRLQAVYDQLAESGELETIDATRPVHQLQEQTRALFQQVISRVGFSRLHQLPRAFHSRQSAGGFAVP
jgi:dTMP kinase